MIETIPVPIVQKTLVHADRRSVFRAIATAEGLDGWFTTGASFDTHVGGTITFRWLDWGPEGYTGEAGGPVTEYREPELFAFQWWTDPATDVRIELQERGDDTLVVVTETGYENGTTGWERCLDCAVGWGEALTLLKFFVEHGLTY